jgi:hypothetical protein
VQKTKRKKQTMKKLMALAAAVMMAVVANAGAVKWQCFGIGDDATGEYDGALAYLILSTEATSMLDNTEYVNALSGKTFNGVNTSEAVYWTEIDTTVGSFAGGDFVQAYMILIDTDSLDTYENYKISAVLSNTFGANGDLPYNFTESIANTEWVAVGGGEPVEPIPEPTSGLLFLLGMAGLALKRKHA